MSALTQLLCDDIKKHIDLKEQELRTYAEMRNAIMTWGVDNRLEKEREMECKALIAEELQEVRILKTQPETDPMENNGQKTQDGCRAT